MRPRWPLGALLLLRTYNVQIQRPRRLVQIALVLLLLVAEWRALSPAQPLPHDQVLRPCFRLRAATPFNCVSSDAIMDYDCSIRQSLTGFASPFQACALANMQKSLHYLLAIMTSMPCQSETAVSVSKCTQVLCLSTFYILSRHILRHVRRVFVRR